MRQVLAVAAVALLAGCTAKEAAPDSTATATPAAPDAPATAVQIMSPAEGDSVGPDVEIRLTAQGVTIEKAALTRVEGFGHYHLYLDAPVSAEGAVIPPNSATVVHIGTGDSTYTYKGLAPGAHEVIAVIGYGDHSLMNTRRDTGKFVV
jgi:hypothetical protein